MKKDDLEGRIILQLPYPILTGVDALDGISIAAVFVKNKPAILSVNDIKIYKLTWSESKKFAGYCFAVCIDEVFFASIVGSNQVISFSEKTFTIEECSIYEIPIKGDKDIWYSLVVETNEDKSSFAPKGLKKSFRLFDNNDEMVLTFDDGTTISKAVNDCREYLENV